MKKKRKPTRTNDAVKTKDAFRNQMARLGFGTPNLLEATEYPLTRLTQNWQLLNSLYRSHWLIRRIIDVVPGDMLKNWIKITSQMPPDALKRFDTLVRKTQLKKRLLEGLRWGRLYGGAAGVILIEGQGDMLAEPLDLDTVMPGTFKGLLVLDRWSGITPLSAELVTDLNDPDFGLPARYIISTETISRGIEVHHSRIVRFTGRDLPFWEKQQEMYWGASEVEHVFDELKKRDNTSWNIASLVFNANIRVMKYEDLAQIFTTLDEQAIQDIYNIVQAQNWLMSNTGTQLLGKNDDFQTFQYAFSGLDKVYENFMLDLAGAAEMPVTKLFGRSPAGLNATGESDMQNYDDGIEEKQESYLRSPLDKLLPILFMSEFGAIPDDLDYQFNKVRTPSAKENTDLASTRTTAVKDVYDSGLVSQKIALKELRQMSDETGMWTNITDEDIEKADDTTQQGEMLPDLNDLGLQDQRLTTDADFKEEDHPRDKNGKFGNGGESSQHQRPSIKVSENGANKFSRGFSKNNLKVHMDKHNHEYPGMSAQQYEKRALDLVQKPVGGDIHGHANTKEQVVRYDAKENDFVKGKPDIGIATMFKPKDGMDYYIREKKRDKND
ncbi:hypothetical protein SOV_04630 [Sporomusa ovata DSM 2662]|uniref:Phage-related protein HI1409 n=1 Tax=Sporomusa ovata TaxID=2378 RepID=A0A0U1KW74_9FIRM|nr:DUF1073 domain-containing protein [Sporomusa ovata]EQB28133.1 phage-associated protein, HI1409 family [Sporomusa ovata DSM 2662]CQR71667.1 Phage-related protein HI1409 [Sporomusa ovata]